MEKIYDPRDTTLKFVERPDDLNPVGETLNFSLNTFGEVFLYLLLTLED